MKKAFFFDRDGTLNLGVYRYDSEHKKWLDGAPENVSELKIVEGAKKIIEYVQEKGFIPIIVSNQPDFLKKGIPLHEYEKITSAICKELGLKRAQIFECFHKEGFSSECECRKPKHGMFLMAKGLFDLDLENSWMVGDSWKDMGAAEAAGIKNTIFLKRKRIENKQAGNEEEIAKMAELKINPGIVIADLNEIMEILKSKGDFSHEF